jgi:hypothetical protein
MLFHYPEGLFEPEKMLEDPQVKAIQKLVRHGRHGFFVEMEKSWDQGLIRITR